MKYQHKLALMCFVPSAFLWCVSTAWQTGRVSALEGRLSEITAVSRAYQTSVSECAKERKEWECRAMLGGSAIFMVPNLTMTELK
jgi:hypothetical protein